MMYKAWIIPRERERNDQNRLAIICFFVLTRDVAQDCEQDAVKKRISVDRCRRRQLY